MHVGIVLRGSYPRDVRADKEARALQRTGHRATLLRLDDGEGSDDSRYDDGITIRRFDRRAEYGVGARAVKTASFAATFVDHIWRDALESFVRETGVEALHVHGLPLVKTARLVADDHDLVLVADLHENYPETVRRSRRRMALPRKSVRRTVAPISRLERLERACVRDADRVLASTCEGRRHYVENCGADADRVAVVSNTVDRSRFDRRVRDARDVLERSREEFVVTHVDPADSNYGSKTAIDAMPALLERVPEARLVLASATDGCPDGELRQRAARSSAAGRITFLDGFDSVDAPGLLADSDAGIVLPPADERTRTTIPHELFEHMAARTPPVVTDIGMLGRVVDETEAGRVVPDCDIDALADALGELGTRPERRDRRGTNARDAVDALYNWSVDGRVLADVYDELERGRPSIFDATAPTGFSTVND